jgi:hypothetical protein
MQRLRPLVAASLALSALACLAVPAQAQSRCRVMDPTGTPLNLRTAPHGRILGAIDNGFLVSIIDQARDRNGKPWVYVARHDDGRPMGWVFREFIACY